MGIAPNAGWFDYVPLATRQFNPGPEHRLLRARDHLQRRSRRRSPPAQFIVTILKLARARDVVQPDAALLLRVPRRVVRAALRAARADADTIFLFLDRNVGTTSSTSAHGGSALLWQHLFWIFGHPEVYILIVPAFGIATSIIPAFTQRKMRRLPARRDRRAARRLHRLRRLGAPHVRDRDPDDHAGLLRRRDRDGRDPERRSRSSPGA